MKALRNLHEGYPGARKSERKTFEESAATLSMQIREMEDQELSALWEQAQYGLRGEQTYREWLRRTGYADIRSTRNAYAQYQGIAQFLRRKYGVPCAILSDLIIRERRRRYARWFNKPRM